jgi:Chs5-Arf1p-binding protein BUD7/BCH1
MEEEYRMQKAQGEISPLASTHAVNGRESSEADTMVIHEDGTVVTRDSVLSNSTTLGNQADDDASIRGVSSPTRGASSDSVPDTSSANGSSVNIADGIPIPTIRISTESDREREQEPGLNGDVKQNGIKGAGDTVEKPVQAAAGEAGEGTQELPTTSAAPEPFSFSNKRLCERWLDNLFMVLYEVCVSSLAFFDDRS